MKYLVLLVVVAGVLWWIQRRWQAPQAPRQERPWGWRWGGAQESARKDVPGSAVREEPLVACARCGVLIPKSEAKMRDGRYFCCDDHRQLGSR